MNFYTLLSAEDPTLNREMGEPAHEDGKQVTQERPSTETYLKGVHGPTFQTEKIENCLGISALIITHSRVSQNLKIERSKGSLQQWLVIEQKVLALLGMALLGHIVKGRLLILCHGETHHEIVTSFSHRIRPENTLLKREKKGETAMFVLLRIKDCLMRHGSRAKQPRT